MVYQLLMDKQYDLLVIGEINPDIILSGPDVTPVFGQAEKLIESGVLTIGSSSVIMACGAARLGLRVGFIGLVGDDPLGRYMLESMRERGIDTSHCLVNPEVATGFSVILSQPDDRAILTFPGSIPLLQRSQIDDALLSATRHLHLSSYFLLDQLRPELPTLFAAARQQGVTTSLDTNWDPAGEWAMAEMLPQCDIFLPNAAEVRQITGKTDIEDGVDQLAAAVGMLAVKMGGEGGVARQGEAAAGAKPPLVSVVDTTGAGDSFTAGFIFGYLQGWPLREALQLAVVCGSLSTRAAGGTAGQPTLAEALEYLEQ
jgi:sugar/nucleoside kinase (ribokinase family)